MRRLAAWTLATVLLDPVSPRAVRANGGTTPYQWVWIPVPPPPPAAAPPAPGSSQPDGH